MCGQNQSKDELKCCKYKSGLYLDSSLSLMYDHVYSMDYRLKGGFFSDARKAFCKNYFFSSGNCCDGKYVRSLCV